MVMFQSASVRYIECYSYRRINPGDSGKPVKKIALFNQLSPPGLFVEAPFKAIDLVTEMGIPLL